MLRRENRDIRSRAELLLATFFAFGIALLSSGTALAGGGVAGAQHAAAFSAPPSAAATSNRSGPIEPGSELTLKRAIATALENHPLVKEATSETNAAGEAVGEARAYLGPQVFGVSQYLRSTDNGIGNTSFYNAGGLFPRPTGSNHDLPSGDFSQSWETSDNYMGGVAVSQYLLDFGRRRGYVQQRRWEAASAQARGQLTDLDLIFEVSQRYFNLLQAMQLVKVYTKAVEQREFHLHEAEVKAQAGLRPQLDVYVTQAEVQRAKLHLLDANNAQDDAREALNNAMGLSGLGSDYHPADILTYRSITDVPADLVQTAFKMRPDLKVLEDQAKAMGAQVVQYRSDFFPTVSAAGGYSAMGTGLPAENNFDVGLVISWPIFNSFLTTHQIEEAKLRREAIEHSMEDLRQRIILQVKTAFLDWQAARQRIDRAEQALIASRVELELAEKRYEAGLSSIVELEDAQRHYTFDDAEYANALYGFSVAKAAVDHASGRSLAGM